MSLHFILRNPPFLCLWFTITNIPETSRSLMLVRTLGKYLLLVSLVSRSGLLSYHETTSPNLLTKYHTSGLRVLSAIDNTGVRFRKFERYSKYESGIPRKFTSPDICRRNEECRTQGASSSDRPWLNQTINKLPEQLLINLWMFW